MRAIFLNLAKALAVVVCIGSMGAGVTGCVVHNGRDWHHHHDDHHDWRR